MRSAKPGNHLKDFSCITMQLLKLDYEQNRVKESNLQAKKTHQWACKHTTVDIKWRFLFKIIAHEQATFYNDSTQSGEPSITDYCCNKCKVRCQNGLYTCKSCCFHKKAKGPSCKQLMSTFAWVYTVSHFDINFL